MNALKKKVSNLKKKTQEVNSVAKKRKASSDDDDDSSFHSLNALQQGMDEIDKELKNLEFSSDEEGQIA